MGRRWIRDRERDPYYRRAKREGYVSRAAYKLQQIHRRFRLLRRGDVVVDLGAAPGGWSQLARDLVGPGGRVVAVDTAPMESLEGVETVRGDVREEGTLEALSRALPQGADCVLSDMAPNLSGTRSLDHARSVELAEAALAVAERVLRPGGRLVAKAFQGDLLDDLRHRMGEAFASCRATTPDASPAGSAEVYLVAKGYRGPRRKV